MNQTDFDVGIIGGGPAGTAAAISLLKYAGIRPVVLESSDYSGNFAGQAISPGVLPLLEYLGVRDGFEEDNHLPSYGTSAAWGGSQMIGREFIFSSEGQGWHLDRKRFDERLAETVVVLGGQVMTEARVAWSGMTGGRWHFSVSRRGHPKDELSVRFVIDATGYKATFARTCGARKRIDDRLLAASVVLQTSSEGNGSQCLLVESTPDGWWYSAVLPKGREALVFVSDPGTIRDLQIGCSNNFLKLIQSTVHMKERVENATAMGTPRVHAAYSSLLEPVGGANWVAAGDAAASFDPLTSAGIGHAIYSGIYAARVAYAEIAGLRSPGKAYAAGVVRSYDQYIRMRKSFYMLERRWSEHPFWKRRCLGVTEVKPPPIGGHPYSENTL